MPVFKYKVKAAFLLFISLKFSTELISAELVDDLIGPEAHLEFQRHSKIWEDPNGDVEDARRGLIAIASLEVADTQNACFLLVHGDEHDKQFALKRQRQLLQSDNKRTKALSANFLISLGTPIDRATGLHILKELVEDADMNIAVLSVYELLVRHEIHQDRATEIANAAFESSEEIAKLFSIKSLMILGNDRDSKAISSLEVLLLSKNPDISSAALSILSSCQMYKSKASLLSLMEKAEQNPTGQEGSIAAWYFFQSEATTKRARSIARMRLKNPRIATHQDALILVGEDEPKDHALVVSTFERFLNDNNFSNVFIAAAYFIDYGTDDKKVPAYKALMQLMQDLNFEQNLRVVDLLISCEDENIAELAITHMLSTIITGKGSNFIRQSYESHVGCILAAIQQSEDPDIQSDEAIAIKAEVDG